MSWRDLGWAAEAALAVGLLAGCSPNAAPGNAAPAGAAAAATTAAAVTVPFVGCAQDGQVGPKPAPSGGAKAAHLAPAVAAGLAFYSADGTTGVLGPLGWHCFGAYGSDGTVLYVAPGPIQSADVLSQTWAAGAGPAIELAFSYGDTSGRFAVAQAIMRVFPAHQAFAQGVISEGIEPASDFPAGPFATDRLTRRSDTLVEYATPGGAQGLGTTFSRLTANADQIDGIAALQGETPNLEFLAVRLAPDQRDLATAIVRQLEPDSAAANPETAPSGGAAAAPAASMALGTVQAFYAALGRGDGAAASDLVVPEKRAGGPFSADALSAWYGAMRQPVTLRVATQSTPGLVRVRYGFVDAHGHACDGAADVSVTDAGGQWLISGIHALNGC
jgi:hypothetical protein